MNKLEWWILKRYYAKKYQSMRLDYENGKLVNYEMIK